VTAAQDGAFHNGWNLLRFDWNGATVVGSPDETAVDYLRFTVNYNGTAETDIRLDNIICNRGTIYEIDYYSKYLFTDGTTSAWKEKASDDSDIVNLDTDSYNIYLNKCAEFACQNIKTMSSDAASFKKDYDNGIALYQGKNKSEAKKPTANYYILFKR
jgi:hypothetical protein